VELCRKLRWLWACLKSRLRIYIVSNQSGVGRGLITKAQVHAVNEEMNRQLGKKFFSAIYNVMPHRESYCEERKPSPALVLQAAREHGFNLKKSFFWRCPTTCFAVKTPDVFPFSFWHVPEMKIRSGSWISRSRLWNLKELRMDLSKKRKVLS